MKEAGIIKRNCKMDMNEEFIQARKLKCRGIYQQCFESVWKSILDGEMTNSKEMLKEKLAKCSTLRFEHFHLGASDSGSVENQTVQHLALPA